MVSFVLVAIGADDDAAGAFIKLRVDRLLVEASRTYVPFISTMSSEAS